MSISQVGAATGTTSATVPAHNIGDLIIIYAYRSGSTTAPSLGAGFTSIRTQAGTTCSARIGFKIATSTSDTSGTWTNATQLTCLVYRSSNYSTGSSLFIGGSASTSSTTTTVNYPALTMTHADNTSWAIGFAGTSVSTAALSTHAPSGMTFFTGSDVTATVEVCAFDTNGTVSSWSSTNTTVSAAGNSVSATVELIENQPGTAINNFVQHIASATAAPVGIIGNTYDHYVQNFDPTLAGNGLVVTVCYPSGLTPTITDNKSNSWPASGAAGTVTADGGAGNMALQSFILASATTGTSQIIVDFGGNPIGSCKIWIDQLFGVTGTLEGNAHAAGVNATGIVAPGSFTPSVANCLIMSFMAPNSTGVGTNPAMINCETGYVLNDADISITDSGAAFPSASQYQLQTTATATNSRFYLNTQAATDTYNVISFALSTGVQGTLPATGPGQAPWILKKCHFAAVNASSPASWLLQVPGQGNCSLFMSYLTSSAGGWTAVNDNDGVSWTFENPTPGSSSAFIRTNISTGRSNRTATVSLGANQNVQLVYYDITNTAVSPVVATTAANGGTEQNVTVTGNEPSITPTGPNQLTIAYMQMGTGPGIGVVTPTGAVYDLPFAYQWQGLASVSASTTWTQGTTTWGSNNTGASSPNTIFDVTTPAEFASGVSIVGAGPTNFTLSNSASTVTNDTMRIGFDDGNFMAQGNCLGHYYNGANTATQNWTWNICNIPGAVGNSVSPFAIILAGPTSSLVAPPELGTKFSKLGVPKGPFSFKFMPNSQAFTTSVLTTSLTAASEFQFKSLSNTPNLSAAIKATSEFQVKELAQSSGKVSLSAYEEFQTKSLTSIAGRVPISALSAFMEKILSNTPNLPASITGRSEAQVKSLAQSSGVVGLTARTEAMLKALASPSFGGLVSLIAQLTSMFKSSANTPNLPASISARSETQFKILSSSTASLPLTAFTSTVFKSLAKTPSLLASISAVMVSQTKKAASPKGALTLTANLTSQSKANIIITTTSNFAALIGNMAIQLKSSLFQIPVTSITTGGRSDWTRKLNEYTKMKNSLSQLGKYAAQARWKK